MSKKNDLGKKKGPHMEGAEEVFSHESAHEDAQEGFDSEGGFPSNNVHRRRQKILFFGVIVLGSALLWFLFLALFGEEMPQNVKGGGRKRKEEIVKTIQSWSGKLTPEETWRVQMETEQSETKTLLQELKERFDNEAEMKNASSLGDQKLEELQGEVGELKELILKEHARGEEEKAARGAGGIFKLSLLGGGDTFSGKDGEKGSATLKAESEKIKKTVDNTIPAGTFASAVLLSGVDASSAMASSSDPRPILLRILDPGTLPRRFQSDLKNCHVIASSYGDLSSERVYARLEKLTCVETATGEIVETSVAGYVAGEDGKVGIRGKVVSKEAAYLGRAMVGGIFAGLSQVASPSNRAGIVNPFAAGNQKIDAMSTGATFKSGMLSGTSTALDRVSDYYINRADQLEPVIEVASGRVVDIIFTEEASIGETRIKKALAHIRDEARLKVIEKEEREETLKSNPLKGIFKGEAQ